MIAVIFGPHLKRLQSYMVRFGFLIAIILSSFRDQLCHHILSLLRSRLQSYLVLIGEIVAIISGPALYAAVSEHIICFHFGFWPSTFGRTIHFQEPLRIFFPQISIGIYHKTELI